MKIIPEREETYLSERNRSLLPRPHADLPAKRGNAEAAPAERVRLVRDLLIDEGGIEDEPMGIG